MLEEPFHPLVVELVEKRANIGLKYPVGLLANCHSKRIQGSMLRPTRSVAIRDSHECSFVNGLKHHSHCLLADLVLERRYAERSTAAIRFGNVHPSNRLRMVVAAMNAVLQVSESGI